MLIRVENQWTENYRTTTVRSSTIKTSLENCGNLFITRDMRILSPALGVFGAGDVLEFHRGSTGIC